MEQDVIWNKINLLLYYLHNFWIVYSVCEEQMWAKLELNVMERGAEEKEH